MQKMTEDSQDFSKEEEYLCFSLYISHSLFSFYISNLKPPLYSNLFRILLYKPFRDTTVQSHDIICAF
jgi:hypothetical protein